VTSWEGHRSRPCVGHSIRCSSAGLLTPRDRRGFGGAPPRLPAHLVLKERAHPQPCALAPEGDRRPGEAPSVNSPAGSQDSIQSPRRFLKQACLPLLEVIDPDWQPAPGLPRHVHVFALLRMDLRPDDLSAQLRWEVPSHCALTAWAINSPRPVSASSPISASTGGSALTSQTHSRPAPGPTPPRSGLVRNAGSRGKPASHL
jgi:hypothetical protein